MRPGRLENPSATLRAMVVSRDTRFATGLSHLDEFIAQHGHAKVPSGYECKGGFPLGRWVAKRRAARRAGGPTPTADQVRQLDERGFEWAPTRLGPSGNDLRAFEVGLGHLDEFITQHGHANVRTTYQCDDGFNLGQWVNSRRKSRRAGRATPTPDQIRQLDERGFDWKPDSARSERGFEAGLAHLDEFIAQYGHANVRTTYQCDDGFNLDQWVISRRYLRRAGRSTPTPDQIRQLDERGFDWKPDSARSERGFEARLTYLDEFLAQYGHAKVPSDYQCDDGFNLGQWVNSRRKSRRAGRATPTPDQIRQLDERGFDWNPDSARGERAFEAGLAHLDGFIAEHGHVNVPFQYRCAGRLQPREVGK